MQDLCQSRFYEGANTWFGIEARTTFIPKGDEGRANLSLEGESVHAVNSYQIGTESIPFQENGSCSEGRPELDFLQGVAAGPPQRNPVRTARGYQLHESSRHAVIFVEWPLLGVAAQAQAAKRGDRTRLVGW
jgi:hypothetical protein